MARPGFEPMVSRSEVDRANHYSIGHFLKFSKSIYVPYIVMRQKVSLGMIEFCECTARVKLELTPFS